jgi:hypothetical protein
MTVALRPSRAALLVTASLLGAAVGAACDVKVGEKGMSVGVARETASNEWSRSYQLPPNGQLDLSTTNSLVEVTGSTQSQTDVRVVQEAAAMTKEAAKEAIEAMSVQEHASSDHVSIEVGTKDGGMPGRVTTRTTVRLPRGLRMMIKAQNGQVTLENVDGQLTVSVENGQLTGRGVSGGLAATVVNGRLAVDLGSVTAPVALSATNGGVVLGLAADAKADFEATALNGGVNVDPQLKLVTETSPGERAGRGSIFGRTLVAGRLNGGGPKISVQVTNGGVRVGLPGTFGQRLR